MDDEVHKYNSILSDNKNLLHRSSEISWENANQSEPRVNLENHSEIKDSMK